MVEVLLGEEDLETRAIKAKIGTSIGASGRPRDFAGLNFGLKCAACRAGLVPSSQSSLDSETGGLLALARASGSVETRRRINAKGVRATPVQQPVQSGE